MSIVAGTVTVTILGTVISEVYAPSSGPNLARELYTGLSTDSPPYSTGRKAAMKLPNPNMPKGCQLASQANPGDTTLHVTNSFMGGWDATQAYAAGDRLGTVNWVDFIDGQYTAQSADLIVGSVPDASHIVLATAIPSVAVPQANPTPPPATVTVNNPVLPAGTSYGYQDTLANWQAKVAVQLYNILYPLSLACNADAAAIALEATGAGYTPAVPGNWSGSPPTTVAGALDRIAANTSNTHPIP